MANVCENPYKIARKMAGFTQERAAVLLNVSVDSLRDYEADLRPVPNDVAFAMCGVYNANHLAIEHLRMSSIGRAALPKFKLCELPVAVLGYTYIYSRSSLIKTLRLSALLRTA